MSLKCNVRFFKVLLFYSQGIVRGIMLSLFRNNMQTGILVLVIVLLGIICLVLFYTHREVRDLRFVVSKNRHDVEAMQSLLNDVGGFAIKAPSREDGGELEDENGGPPGAGLGRLGPGPRGPVPAGRFPPGMFPPGMFPPGMAPGPGMVGRVPMFGPNSIHGSHGPGPHGPGAPEEDVVAGDAVGANADAGPDPVISATESDPAGVASEIPQEDIQEVKADGEAAGATAAAPKAPAKAEEESDSSDESESESESESDEE